MKLKERIELNKNSKTGSVLICPICNNEFVKKSYQHIYCSLQCKDKRHNRINSDRHRDPDYYTKRNSRYNSNRFFLQEIIDEDIEDAIDMMSDNDWGDTYYGDQK